MKKINFKRGSLDIHFIFLILASLLLLLLTFYLLNYSSGNYNIGKFEFKAKQLEASFASPYRELSDLQLTELINAYNLAIEQNPTASKAADIHFKIARIYTHRKDFEKAADELTRLIINFSKNNRVASKARFALAKLYELAGDWDRALGAYQDVIFYHPLSQNGLLAPIYIAERYKSVGESQLAEEAYQEAIEHYQSQVAILGEIIQTAVLHHYIGLAKASSGDWQGAIDEWDLILNKYPTSPIVPKILLMQGEAYANQINDTVKAISVYKRLIEDYPESDQVNEAKLRLVRVYFFSDQYEKARDWCLSILDDRRLEPTLAAEIQLILAKTYEKQGYVNEAKKVYDQITQEYPNTSAALKVPIIRAKASELQGKVVEANQIYKEAIGGYRHIIENSSDEALVVNAEDLITLAYMQQSNWNALLEHLDEVLGRAQDPRRVAQLLFLKANILNQKLNDTESAGKFYKDFLNRFPDHAFTEFVREQVKELEPTSENNL